MRGILDTTDLYCRLTRITRPRWPVQSSAALCYPRGISDPRPGERCAAEDNCRTA